MAKDEYNYQYGAHDKAVTVTLEDGTIVYLFTDKMCMNIRYPIGLVEKLLEKHKKEGRKDVDFYWTPIECKALVEGFHRAVKMQKEEKEKQEQDKKNKTG